MADNNGTNGTENGTTKLGLTTVSTKTHGENALPLESIGTLDGITAHGEPIVVRPMASGRVEIIVAGKSGQLYVENKPRPTTVTHPKLTVNGKPRKNVSYDRGAFPSHPSGKNTAPRIIARTTVTDATVTLTTGETVTLTGDYTVMSMVKTLKTGKMLRQTVVVRGTDVVVKFING